MAGGRRNRHDGKRDPLPGWLWMLFGLCIGLAVAFAVFTGRRSVPPAARVAAAPAPAAVTSETRRDTAGPSADAPAPPEARFAFYDMLPSFEVVIPEAEPQVTHDVRSGAIVDPGEYVLQAGSFSRFEDADRRRAELALHGIESTIQRVSIDDKVYHRVRIGPTRDLDELNLQRARLRNADIDVLRIRLGD